MIHSMIKTKKCDEISNKDALCIFLIKKIQKI